MGVLSTTGGNHWGQYFFLWYDRSDLPRAEGWARFCRTFHVFSFPQQCWELWFPSVEVCTQPVLERGSIYLTITIQDSDSLYECVKLPNRILEFQFIMSLVMPTHSEDLYKLVKFQKGQSPMEMDQILWTLSVFFFWECDASCQNYIGKQNPLNTILSDCRKTWLLRDEDETHGSSSFLCGQVFLLTHSSVGVQLHKLFCVLSLIWKDC